jgi:hypothetical protein
VLLEEGGVEPASEALGLAGRHFAGVCERHAPFEVVLLVGLSVLALHFLEVALGLGSGHGSLVLGSAALDAPVPGVARNSAVLLEQLGLVVRGTDPKAVGAEDFHVGYFGRGERAWAEGKVTLLLGRIQPNNNQIRQKVAHKPRGHPW